MSDEIYEHVYRDKPDLLEQFRRKGEQEREARLYYFLHEKGYSYFDIPKLTYLEVLEMVNGEVLSQEESQKAIKK